MAIEFFEHGTLDPEFIHAPFRWYWDNGVERSAETPTADDLYRVGWQRDNNTFWVLAQVTPSVAWVAFGGGGGTAGSTAFSPAGNISADTVQGAIEELDAEKQPLAAALTALAALTPANNKGAYFTGSTTAALFDLTGAGRALLDDADAAAQLVTLGITGDIITHNASEFATQAELAATQNGFDFKGSVRVASTANVNISSAPSSIDGVTLNAADRVLLKNQTAPAENGLYRFNGAGSAMTRTSDADSDDEVTPGLYVYVEEGTQALFYYLTTAAPITLGTTALTFTALNPLTAAAAGDAIGFSAGVLNVLVDNSTIEINSDSLRIKDNGVTLGKLVQIAAHSWLGNNTGSTANVAAFTSAQLMADLPDFVGDSGSGGTAGRVPAPASGDAAASKFLSANGTWQGVTGADAGGASGLFALTGDISPSQITSNQNDYSPTGLSGASVLRINSDAARNITGLGGGSDGRLIFIFNVGSFAITLKSQDTGSTAGNRFGIPADLVIAAGAGTALYYDNTSARWRLFGSDGGASLTANNTWTGVQTYGAGTLAVTSAKVITNFVDTNGNIILGFTPTASATRYVGIKNVASGNPEIYVAAGGSNSDLVLRPDGVGKVLAIGGLSDNSEFWIKANSFRPGYMDVVTPSNGAVGVRASAMQAHTQYEFGDNAAYGTISYSSNTIVWNIAASSGLKIGNSTSQKVGFWNTTPVVQPSGAAQAALTNSTGGTGDGTLEDVTTTGLADPAKVNNNFTEVYTLLNAIRTALVNIGLMKGAA